MLQNDQRIPRSAENPYFHRGPIKDRRYFYGRATETRRALYMLRHGQSVSIVGSRRIGKTSFLFHLCDLDTHRAHNLGNEHLFVYIDGQSTGDLDKSKFYYLIWYEIREALAKVGTVAELPESVADFRELQTALTRVQEKGIKPILLLDEFEVMAFNSNLDRGFFSDLRSLELLMAYMTVSARSLYDLTYADRSVLSSPFFNTFSEIPLGFFRSDEAREAVLGPARAAGLEDPFTDQELRFVFEELAGYHPFYLQIACYYLFEQKLEREELTEANLDAVRQQYTKDVERHFQYAWIRLEPEEQTAVQLVLQGRTNRLTEEVNQRLERQCILLDGSLFSPVFAKFVRAQTARPLSSEGTAKTVPCRVVSEARAQELEKQGCHLHIMCNRQGQIHVRLSGSLFYEGESKTFNTDIVERVERFARRVADARHLPESWRFQIKEIGLELYRELFQNQPKVLTSYHRAKGKVRDRDLRISLSAPRDFHRLPFEAIFAEEDMYLSLKHPLSRHVLDHYTERKSLSRESIERFRQRGFHPRALLVASNTWHSSSRPIPQVDVEIEQVGTLLRQHDFDVRILSTVEASLHRVEDELKSGDYCLFHYAGHGKYDADSPERSALFFWEGAVEQSKIAPLTAVQLGSIVRDTPLLFAYLSCCWGAEVGEDRDLLDGDFLGIMDAFVMGGVPAVLGFRWPVSDEGSRVLAQVFYTALLEEGRELDEALLEARKRLDRDSPDWFSPILIVQTLS
ncbi:MAG: CHAT domain-containing protein [Chloroflexota bacterium]